MKDLRDEKIQRIERRLLKAHRIQIEELREIVSAPRVFGDINTRIKAEKARQTSENRVGKRTVLFNWNWQKAGLAFGGLVVLLGAGTWNLFFFANRDMSLSRLAELVSAPEIQNPAPFVEDEKPLLIKTEKSKNSVSANRILREKKIFKNKTVKSENRPSKEKPRRKVPPSERYESEAVFYPLAFAESLEEAKENGQIIRVELTRSSLLALGLNPPMNNESLKIKTDLLIGSDGVARGIRFVE